MYLLTGSLRMLASGKTIQCRKVKYPETAALESPHADTVTDSPARLTVDSQHGLLTIRAHRLAQPTQLGH
jgi:hypothetical protein